MSNDDIIRALNHTNAPSELVDTIVAALDDLDRMYQMEAEIVSQAHALDGAIESVIIWTEIAEQRQATIESLEAENATLRARLDDCAAALMVDAEGRGRHAI
jgi:uncharacterized protein YPO0396